MSRSFPPLDELQRERLRLAILAAIRHAMETACGYCPEESELEEAVQVGLEQAAVGPG